MQRSKVEGEGGAFPCTVQSRALAEPSPALYIEGGEGLNAPANFLKGKGSHVAFLQRFEPSRKQVHRHIVMFLKFSSKKTVSPTLSLMKGA